MINPTQLGFSTLPLNGFSPMMMPSMMMGGGMDLNQLMMYLQKLMMGQNGLLNPAAGTFPMADPGFGKGEVGAGGGGGGSIDDSFRNNFSTGSGGAGILNSFLGGGSGLGGMMSSLLGGATGGNFGGGNLGGGFTGGNTGGGYSGGVTAGAPAGGSTYISSGMTAPNVNGGVGRIAIANELMAKVESGQLTLPRSHPSGVTNDGATPFDNIRDTAAGKATLTSGYSDAGGASTYLDGRMLNALNELSDKYNLSISSIAGADHSSTSRHYAGLGFDINAANGQPINANHPDLAAIKADLAALGATEILGPGDDAGHKTHIHAAWPRENAQNGAFTEAEIAEQNSNVKTALKEAAAADSPEGVVKGLRSVDQAIETGKDAIKAAQKAEEAKEGKDSKDSKESKTDSGSSKESKSSDSGASSSTSDSKSSSNSSSSDSGSSSSSSSDSSSSSSKSESKSSSSSSSSSSKSESKSSSSSSSSSGSSGSSSSKDK